MLQFVTDLLHHLKQKLVTNVLFYVCEKSVRERNDIASSS